jgi:ArpU family phage transcriptional regulator
VNKQLSFMLPEIERDMTKMAVEATLEKYRIYLLTVPEEKVPKVTASYSLVPPAFTNEFHSSTEDAAISMVDKEREREKFIEWVRKAINKLHFKEREMIIKRYLENEEIYDYELYNQLGMSERKYYRLKARAFYKLAFALKIEVYENK